MWARGDHSLNKIKLLIEMLLLLHIRIMHSANSSFENASWQHYSRLKNRSIDIKIDRTKVCELRELVKTLI